MRIALSQRLNERFSKFQDLLNDRMRRPNLTADARCLDQIAVDGSTGYLDPMTTSRALNGMLGTRQLPGCGELQRAVMTARRIAG